MGRQPRPRVPDDAAPDARRLRPCTAAVDRRFGRVGCSFYARPIASTGECLVDGREVQRIAAVLTGVSITLSPAFPSAGCWAADEESGRLPADLREFAASWHAGRATADPWPAPYRTGLDAYDWRHFADARRRSAAAVWRAEARDQLADRGAGAVVPPRFAAVRRTSGLGPRAGGAAVGYGLGIQSAFRGDAGKNAERQPPPYPLLGGSEARERAGGRRWRRN